MKFGVRRSCRSCVSHHASMGVYPLFSGKKWNRVSSVLYGKRSAGVIQQCHTEGTQAFSDWAHSSLGADIPSFLWRKSQPPRNRKLNSFKSQYQTGPDKQGHRISFLSSDKDSSSSQQCLRNPQTLSLLTLCSLSYCDPVANLSASAKQTCVTVMLCDFQEHRPNKLLFINHSL